MQQTGKRVAEMHIALASHPEVPDFAPEPITLDASRDWAETVAASADRMLDELRRRRDTLKEGDRTLVDELLAARDVLMSRIHGLLGDDGGLNIRHHGDFHLGQMLIVKDDIYIIDFEGEPRRTLDERRAKAPAARDVAGLIRSIDYSTTAALERALKAASDEPGRLTEALDLWRIRATGAFLDAYRQTMGDSPVWPADIAAADRVLDFFLIEKALYEIDYEIAHRPDWVHVPLVGILRILSPPPEELP